MKKSKSLIISSELMLMVMCCTIGLMNGYILTRIYYGHELDSVTITASDVRRTYKEVYLTTECEGLDIYYNRTGEAYFWDDYYNMHEDYDACYNSTEVNNSIWEVYTPLDLWNCSQSGIHGYDCDDFAFASYCLANAYNYSCDFGALYKLYKGNKKGHFYTECFVEDDYYRLDTDYDYKQSGYRRSSTYS